MDRYLYLNRSEKIIQVLKNSVNFSIDFISEGEYNKTSFYQESYFSPPMLFSFGCIHCVDLGPINKIIITTEKGEIIHEFKNDLEPIKFKIHVDNQKRQVKIFQENDLIPTIIKLDCDLKYSKEISIGKGYFNRVWKGKFDVFYISILQNDGQEIEFSAIEENIFIEKISCDKYLEPIVSIIIPVHNSEKYILQCINSVVNQDYKNLDIIIVNDSSLDNSIELIKHNYFDKRIRIIDNYRKKGVSGARNSGILSSIGDYICFLDSDDYMDANSVSMRAKHLSTNLGHHFVFCKTSLVDLKRQKLNWVLEAKPELTFNDFHSNYIHTNGIMIRKSKLGKILYNESKTNGEDWLFHAQISRLGHKWFRVNGTKAYYRQNNATVRKDILGHEKKINEILDLLFSVDKTLDLRNTHPNYHGIKSIDPNVIKLKRHVGLLFYLGLSTPNLESEDLKWKYDDSEYWNNDIFSSEILLNILKFSTSRVFLCKTDVYEDYVLSFKHEFLKFLSYHLKEDKYKFIHERLEKLLSKTPLNKIERILENSPNDILLYPEFKSQDEYNREVLRLCWYLIPIKDKISKIYINSEYNEVTNVPNDFDPNALKYYNDLKHKFHTYSIDNSIASLKYILCLSQERLHDLTENLNHVKYEKLIKVDSHKDQYAASYYLKLSSEFNHDERIKNKLESKSKFNHFIKIIESKGFNKTFVFGTGPNLSKLELDEFDFESSLTIACNSMVKDKKLLKIIKPNIFVAADPIFHAGCSSYAKLFRDELRNCLDLYPESFLIIPERDLPVYLFQFSDINPKRIIGIPFKNESENNFNLAENFYVKTYSNVLTLFLLPIAATFTREILISGCDGKKALNNSYFWSHNSNVQFVTEMDNIKTAHPSFFNINYDQYYLDHCANLKIQIKELLRKGFTIKNLTPSYIPILRDLNTNGTDLEFKSK